MDERMPVSGRRVRRAQIGIVIATVLALALVALAVGRAWPNYSGEGWQEPHGGSAYTPWHDGRSDPRDAMDSGWKALNQALQDQDREAFLSHAAPEAREAMSRWWDNTTSIGWETAYMLPDSLWGEARSVRMGNDLGFQAAAPWGRGNPAAGQKLTQSLLYDVEVEGEGEELTITSFSPDTPMPWDEDEIHVAKREHVVLYGLAQDEDYIEEQADLAEEEAAPVLAVAEELNGGPFIEGFTLAVTADEDHYEQWWRNALMISYGYSDSLHRGSLDREAAASVQFKRPIASALTPADVAVSQQGEILGGILTIVGPRGSATEEWGYAYEFGRILHLVGRTGTDTIPRPSDRGGFARFISDLAAGEEVRASEDARAEIAETGKNALLYYRWDQPGENSLHLGEEIAALYFHFLHETGGDPWQVALDLSNAPAGTLSEVIEEQPDDLGAGAWQEWVAGL